LATNVLSNYSGKVRIKRFSHLFRWIPLLFDTSFCAVCASGQYRLIVAKVPLFLIHADWQGAISDYFGALVEDAFWNTQHPVNVALDLLWPCIEPGDECSAIG
jgi:hypothetical protein